MFESFMDSMDIGEARRLLELPENFSREELLRAYHRKLFQIHPDTAESAEATREAGKLVPSILAAREVLEHCLEQASGNRRKPAAQSPSPVGHPAAPGPGDFREPGKDGYEWYRRAMSILGDALDEYWRERVKWSSMPQDAPAVKEFHEKLRLAKVLFGRVLDRFPGGMWTADAVEQIAGINTWLGS